MHKAFVDTTVLTDILLKPGEARRVAKAGLARFDKSLLPVYAIKEFKAGPLRAFVWFHNKLVSVGSYEGALAALQRLSFTAQRYLTATAIEALRTSAYAAARVRLGQLVAAYGEDAKFESVQRDENRLALRTLIMKAWQRRLSVTSEVVEPLSCYTESAPAIRRGLLDLQPTRCKPAGECCLGPRLKARPDHLQKLKDAVRAQDQTPERRRRYQALRNLIRKPKILLAEGSCRDLGDAVFAFFAPADATILTTNLKDHEALACALEKKAEAP